MLTACLCSDLFSVFPLKKTQFTNTEHFTGHLFAHPLLWTVSNHYPKLFNFLYAVYRKQT